MDLLASDTVKRTILEVDREGTQVLKDFVTDLTYRNPDIKNFLIDGYGGAGGRMNIGIKYRLLQNSQIERRITATFVTDTGQVISSSSTVVVEKVS